MTLALQALWKGLMYDPATLDEALRLAPRLSCEDALALRETVARDALDARHAGVNVLAIAKELVELATIGLNAVSPEEVHYLDILRQQVVGEETCPADILLNRWHDSWPGSINRLVEFLRIA
jgi:glutamate--cysteine ligase